MELLGVLVLVSLVLVVALLVVQWEDRRAARAKATRVQAALMRIGEHQRF